MRRSMNVCTLTLVLAAGFLAFLALNLVCGAVDAVAALRVGRR